MLEAPWLLRRIETTMHTTRVNPLIVALDVPGADHALELVRRLHHEIRLFKVGLQLYTAAGPRVIEEIRSLGAEVFLDLKLFDIPNTVANAAVEAARMGVSMMTLHTLGGRQMMTATKERLLESSTQEGWRVPKLLGVTILTSMDQAALDSIGIHEPVGKVVLRLAESAHDAGLDGVVCSPLELPLLREAGLEELLRVTPGIRAPGAAADDQARTMSASEAIQAGADYLVVGRPVTKAAEPLAAVRNLLSQVRFVRTEDR